MPDYIPRKDRRKVRHRSLLGGEFGDGGFEQGGSATGMASEIEVQGLERRKQYGFRVRAVRAEAPAPTKPLASPKSER